MSELFYKLGIDWKLLLAQAVNFALLLIILRIALYKPLLALLSERRGRIAKGLEDAEEARQRLKEADATGRQKIKEGEERSLALIKDTEARAKTLEARLLNEARRKEEEIIARAKERGEGVVEEEREKFFAEATSLVREAIVSVVHAKRESIDEGLIAETLKKAKRARV